MSAADLRRARRRERQRRRLLRRWSIQVLKAQKAEIDWLQRELADARNEAVRTARNEAVRTLCSACGGELELPTLCSKCEAER